MTRPLANGRDAAQAAGLTAQDGAERTLELMRSRRSVRRYKPDRLSRARVEALIAAAALAPSASNKQPWRFYVTDDPALIGRMAEAVQAAVERISRRVEPAAREAFRAYGDYFVRFREAPVVIVPVFRELVVLSNLVDAAIDPADLECIRSMEFNSGLASASLAIGNLMLYAHAGELGTSCMTGPLVARDELKALLGVPESWQIAAVIAAGFPAEAPAATTRKPIEAVVRWVGAKGG